MSRQSRKKDGDHPRYLADDYPAPEGLMEEFDVPYTGQDGAALAMDIYRKKDHDGSKLPVIILIHGGGLMVGHPRMERKVCEYLAGKGYLVFAPGYRMMIDTDGCGEIGDICDGFRHIRNVLRRYGGDPNRIYVIAESAGVFLADNAIAMMRSRRLRQLIGRKPARLDIKAMAGICGMFYITRKDLIGFLYPREIFPEIRKNRWCKKYMNPESKVIMSRLPPMILISSKGDFLKKYSREYAKALEDAGHDSKLVYYGDHKELKHAFPTLHPELPESRDALERVLRWFDQHK